MDFTQYSYYDFKNDSFFPDINNNDLLKQTLYNYSSLDNIDDVESKINNIISTLNNCYNNALNKLNSYKNSNYYNKYKNNITVNKIIINQKRDNLNIMFYKLVIKKNTHILNNRLNNILNNIIIPINEYNNMKNKYKGDIKLLDTYIWIILFRYQLLGSNNNQLAVLPHILEQMSKDLNFNFECFACY